MEKIFFKKIDEFIYKEILDNGVEVYLYPTQKTKNFYMSITVKYGSKVRDYSINGNNKTITHGVAHFLEHKVMDFVNNKRINKKVNNLGLSMNAYTSYSETNYNAYGSKNPVESLKILLDLFYNFNLDDKSVEKEKGIILEECSNEMNDPHYRIELQETNNVLQNSFLKVSGLGTKEDIKSITKEDLMNSYKDFYNTNNTFIVVTGNFNELEILKEIKKHMKNIKKSETKKIKTKYPKEPDNVIVPYMEIKEEISTPKVFVTFKINQKVIKSKHERMKLLYIKLIFNSLFGRTSKLYEKYKKAGLFTRLSNYVTKTEEHYIHTISATTNKPDEFIKEIKEDLKNLFVDKKTFERKKKVIVSGLVEKFENIENVESIIVGDLVVHNKLYNNIYDLLCYTNYKEFNKVKSSIDFDNYSILKVTPKE